MGERRDRTDRPDANHAATPVRHMMTVVLLGVALVVGTFLVWQVIGVLLLVFAAFVVSSIFSMVAKHLHRWLRIPEPIALPTAIVLITASIGGFFVLTGAQLRSGAEELARRLPQDVEALAERLGIRDLTGQMGEALQNGEALWNIVNYTGGLASVLTGLLVVIVAGAFIAASPDTYRRGFLLLFPGHMRGRIDRAISATSRALELWLVSKVIMMLAVFAATTPGLYFIGVPYALTLGILAGVLEFIPFFGPIIAAAPALLVALSEGGTMVFWVAGLYLVIQQLENNLLVPLTQKYAVSLPPAVPLFSILLFASLFGVLGLLLALPLTVVVVVLIKQLYVRDVLGEHVSLPGTDD
ncbi:AI-2E family transporter [Pelagibacterium xiamenense]|uniref:AI-2E family transporter n=1 Tax=Pelagibacterium xiamenense TaxID=2901140 RepID=UPI001E605CE4|nr:AI-2E family transporter [Pelagibacterium xiamenense]MCD7058654.1 AI-2E family transporter [Pelagibacterium xiamenense]